MRASFSCTGAIAFVFALAVLNYLLLGWGWTYGMLLLTLTPIGLVLEFFFFRYYYAKQAPERLSWVWKLAMSVLFLSASLGILISPTSAARQDRLSLSLFAGQYLIGVMLLLDMLLSWRYKRQQRRVQVAEEK